MARHLERKDLIAAARTGETQFQEHLDSCGECRLLVELLKIYRVVGESPLPNAPQTWRSRAAAVAETSDPIRGPKSVLAKMFFDSWAVPQPVGVRGLIPATERRMRFESAEILFDLRAERFEGGWSFVAQVKAKVTLPSPVTLEVDGKAVAAEEGNLYEWTLSAPPRRIKIKSDDLEVRLPELRWRKSNYN